MKPISTWSSVSNAHTNLSALARAQIENVSAVFIVADDNQNWTYEAFWTLSGRIAAKFITSGARRGDRIMMQVEKSVEALAVFWACARAGLIFIPINTAYTAAEVSYFFDDAEPALFICTPERQAELAPLAKQAAVLTLDACGGGTLLAGMDTQSYDDHRIGWNDAAAILYTSGTTGKSKGAVLSHSNLASNALALIDEWQFTAADKLIHALPIYHTHGLFVAMNTVFLSGGTLLFQRKFVAHEIVALMARATCLMGVPTFYTRLLQCDDLRADIAKNMRLFISGSAPLLSETHRQFEARTGHVILERYGMTETNMITSNPYNGLRKPGSVGLPLPGVSVRVAHGMIEVQGPNVFQAYWRNPEKTAAEFTEDGYFITGDLGQFDDDGYLTISGRGKDLIITGGFNVYPKEVELFIDEMPGVLESAVIGLPHGDFGEGVTAVVVAVDDQTLDPEQIIQALASKLAKFKLPKRIIFVSEMPRNAMGKVQKNVLRQTYVALYL